MKKADTRLPRLQCVHGRKPAVFSKLFITARAIHISMSGLVMVSIMVTCFCDPIVHNLTSTLACLLIESIWKIKSLFRWCFISRVSASYNFEVVFIFNNYMTNSVI